MSAQIGEKISGGSINGGENIIKESGSGESVKISAKSESEIMAMSGGENIS